MPRRARLQGALATLRRLPEPLLVALAVLAAYAAWAGWFAAHHPLVELARIGTEFQQRAPGASEPIDALAGNTVEGPGYDGQFFLFIALAPGDAQPYIDEPAFRYSRIVYPLAARAVAGGQPGLVPFALLAIGIAAVAGGTLALAVLLARRGLSPWYAALLGLCPGVFFAVRSDLAEPLAYALCAGGLLALERRRLLPALGAFALAGLTRETTLLFPLAIAAHLAVARRRHREAALLAASVVPYLALRAGLWIWLDSTGNARAQHLELVPFGGLAGQWPWGPVTAEQLYSVVVPALAALALAAISRARGASLAALAANVLVLVVLLPEPSYADWGASGRITTGVVLAFLLCLPAVSRARRLAQAWILVVLWFAPWWTLLPTAFER